MAEWFRLLEFSAHLISVGSSCAQATCETIASQVLFEGGQLVVFEISGFGRTLRIAWLKMSAIILTSCKFQIKNKEIGFAICKQNRCSNKGACCLDSKLCPSGSKPIKMLSVI